MPETTTSMWTRRKVARLERWEPVPEALVTVGWDCRRECGCNYQIGMRMDKPLSDGRFAFELVLNMIGCGEHSTAGDRAHQRFRDMPPSPEELRDCVERLFEEEIAGE